MYIDLTLNNFLSLFLILVGIGAGIALIMVLLKANTILKNVKDVLDVNTKAIDTTIKQIPVITYNVNELTKELNTTITMLRPEVNFLLSDVRMISGKVNRLTGTVVETTEKAKATVYDLTNSLVNAGHSLKYGTKGIVDYLFTIKEVSEKIMNVLKK